MGHDIKTDGNYLASSKFYMSHDWQLPERGKSLFSFIGLLNFYHRYAPYMKIKLKSLQELLKMYYRKSIPLLSWTPDLISFFEYLKFTVAPCPVLAWLDT